MSLSDWKRLPSLHSYLDSRSVKKKQESVESTIGCVSFLAGVGAAFVLYRFIGWLGPVVAMVAVAPITAKIIRFFVEASARPKSVDIQREAELKKALMALENVRGEKRLVKNLNPVAAALLEESARNWQRIRQVTEGGMWTDKSLPAHWKQVRDQALAASDAAMEDLILLLRSSIQYQGKPERWESNFIGLVEELLGMVGAPEPTRFPPEYVPARAIAQKLNTLALEIEEAAKRLHSQETVTHSFTSSNSIDMVLGELRAINEAETELKQTTEN